MIEQVGPTTYRNRLACGEDVEIGDALSAKFIPHLKLNRFKGESAIICAIPTNQNNAPSFSGDKVIWDGRTRDNDVFHAEMYELTRSPQLELGGFELQITVDKKPRSNRIPLSFGLVNLKAYFQHPLTQPEIDAGCFRPDNVVNSFALYHPTKGGLVTPQDVAKGITTGKAFHIFRPKLRDANGLEVWGLPIYDEELGLWIVEWPLDFWEYAHYPVTHVLGDTFGYGSQGGSYTSMTQNWLYTSYNTYSPASDGTGYSITAYIRDNGDPARFGLYIGGNLVSNGCTAEVAASGGGGWEEGLFGTGPSVASASSYYLAAHGGASGGMRWYYDNGAGGVSKQVYASYAAGCPSSVSWSNGPYDSIYSVYCTYTPSGGGPYEVSASDGLSLGEPTRAISLIIGLSAADGLKGSEATAQPLTIPKAAADGLIAGDAPLAQGILNALASDGVTFSEALACFRIVSIASLTVQLHGRSLTCQLDGRTLTLKLYGRDLTCELYDRDLTLETYDQSLTMQLEE